MSENGDHGGRGVEGSEGGDQVEAVGAVDQEVHGQVQGVHFGLDTF